MERNKGKFVKGKSGNPQGRRKEVHSKLIWEKAGEEGRELIHATIRDENIDMRHRLEAAKYACDMAYGKAKQQLEVAGEEGGPIKTLTQVIISVLDTQARPSAIDVTPEPIAIPSTNKEDA